ncbi:hypothetical protein NPIL_227981, partial [Nephila pilipes]
MLWACSNPQFCYATSHAAMVQVVGSRYFAFAAFAARSAGATSSCCAAQRMVCRLRQPRSASNFAGVPYVAKSVRIYVL